MLLRFKCEECGTVLVARAGFGSGEITCRSCGAHAEIPESPDVPDTEPRVMMPGRLDPEEDERVREAARQASIDAESVAWAEARSATASERLRGMIFTTIGSIVSALGVSGYFNADVLDFPRTSCLIAAGLGAIGCLIGITIWRLASQATRYEYEKRYNIVVDRIRQQYLSAYQPAQTTPEREPTSTLYHAPVAPTIRRLGG